MSISVGTFNIYHVQLFDSKPW